MAKKTSNLAPFNDLLNEPIVQLLMAADGITTDDVARVLKTASAQFKRNADRSAFRREEEYRPAVGVMLVNRDGKVFVGKRKDAIARAWQMPQGGIDNEETPQEAAFRELKEEIGTNRARIILEGSGWLYYDFPEAIAHRAFGGRWRGQRQKWVLMEFLGDDENIDVETEHPEFTTWRWVDPEVLPSLIVGFKRDLYRQVLRQFRGRWRTPESQKDISA